MDNKIWQQYEGKSGKEIEAAIKELTERLAVAPPKQQGWIRIAIGILQENFTEQTWFCIDECYCGVNEDSRRVYVRGEEYYGIEPPGKHFVTMKEYKSGSYDPQRQDLYKLMGKMNIKMDDGLRSLPMFALKEYMKALKQNRNVKQAKA